MFEIASIESCLVGMDRVATKLTFGGHDVFETKDVVAICLSYGAPVVVLEFLDDNVVMKRVYRLIEALRTNHDVILQMHFPQET